MGYSYFRDRCHRAFEKNRGETDPREITKMVQRGEFVIKELEALYKLKKYRFLKQRYYQDNTDNSETKEMLRKLREYDRTNNSS